MEEIMVVFGFDMETDIGSWTPYYKGLVNGTPGILNLLSRKNIKSTFLFTGEAAKKYPNIVREVAERGHEVGCHSLYHETVGDELFPIPGTKPLLPEEVPFRLRKATEWIEEVLNDKVFSFRAPRLWGSTAVVNTLEKLGYKADVSYPLYYYGEQIVPYHPDKYEWTKKGNLKILEIPNFADMTMESKDEYGRDRDQWPLFRTKGTNELMNHIENYMSYARNRNRQVVLCFYFHPWEFVEMSKGPIHYGEGAVLPDEYLVENCGEYALDQLGKLIDSLNSLKAVFMTAKNLAERWD